MKKYAEGGMTPAELAAMRLNKGKSTEELLREDKDRDIRKKMEGMRMQTEVGETPAGTSMSAEDQMMRQATDAGYAAAKKKPFKAGGSVGSASKRADGCAVRGKTKGRMV